MKITAIFPTRTFKLLIEFDEKEYRVLDIQDFFDGSKGLFAEIRTDLSLFLTVRGSVRFMRIYNVKVPKSRFGNDLYVIS